MMMKHPILFGTRVLDLSLIILNEDVLERMDVVPGTTDGHFLKSYLWELEHEEIIAFNEMMLNRYSIDMTMLNYKQLKVPYAVDCERYKALPMYVAHYSFSEQDLDFVGVDLGPGNGMEWWHNKRYDRVRNAGDYKTTIKILNDGWI